MIGKPDPAAVAAATSVAAASPIFGEYAIIVLASTMGALVALSRSSSVHERRRWHAANMVFRGVCFGSFSAGAIASVLDRYIGLGIEPYKLLSAVAFVVAVIGDDWFKIKDWVIERWVKPK